MREVKIEVNERGEVKIEVDGVQGPSCSVHTDAIIRAVGGQVKSDDKKPEFYQVDVNRGHLKQFG